MPEAIERACENAVCTWEELNMKFSAVSKERDELVKALKEIQHVLEKNLAANEVAMNEVGKSAYLRGSYHATLLIKADVDEIAKKYRGDK